MANFESTSNWFTEEVYDGLERWLKVRRDEYPKEHGSEAAAHYAIDGLLDEVREVGAEGLLPWQRVSGE